MKIAVVDDELSLREQIGGFLSDIKKADPSYSFEVSYFENGDSFLNSNEQFEIVFFDIVMEGMNGVEAARIFREKNSKSIIIFITNMIEYAVQGYSVEALDYVLKPINFTRFSTLFKKAYRISSERADKTILIKSGGDLVKLNPEDIDYIDVEDHLLLIHLSTKTVDTWMSLSQIEKLLPSSHFVRISNSTIVNLNKISSIKKDSVILLNRKEELSLTSSRKKAFLEKVYSFNSNV